MSSQQQYSWPTVIIGGAPRSGTTSLYDLLLSTSAFRRHPRKELFLLNDNNFWIQGASPGYAQVGMDCYDIAGFRKGDRFIDASTTYLYQETAPIACAHRISAYPDVPHVIVFCLREPTERLYSNFRYFRDVLLVIPARTSFADYVHSIFRGAYRTGNQQIDMALDHGLYPNFLKRWEAAVGAEHIVLVQTDDLKDDGHSIVSRIGAQIGVDLSSHSGTRRNASYRTRSRAMQSLARLLGSRVPHGRLREFLKDAYVRLLPKSTEDIPTPDDLSALERVRSYYMGQRAIFAASGLTWYESE